MGTDTVLDVECDKRQAVPVTPRWLWKALILLVMLVLAFENIALSSFSVSRPTLMLAETPASWFHEARERFVLPADMLHLSLLHATCTSHKDTIVPWIYGLDGEPDDRDLLERHDPRVLDELRRCPDIDIYMPTGLRGAGYCEDTCAYAKYLHSRLLPKWVLEDRYFDTELNRTVGYHDLCPRTPMLFMNHYWDDQHERPEWPKEKPIYVMPNIEMGQLKENAYWRMDVVICKTRGCLDRVTKWYEQQGNPRGTKVVYTRHTTADISNFARLALGDNMVRDKDFHNVRFTHTAGGSPHKGTLTVVNTWLANPGLPHLDVYMSQGLFDWIYRDRVGAQLNRSTNIKVHTERMDAISFGKLLAESAFFLCPSSIEGYGHYINQARAAGGVIITTDQHPMNELISQPDAGIYVRTTRKTHPDMMLGGGYKGEHGLEGFEGLIAEFSTEDVLVAVRQVLAMTPHQRELMAKRVQAKYHQDTKIFAKEMIALAAYARNRSDGELAGNHTIE